MYSKLKAVYAAHAYIFKSLSSLGVITNIPILFNVKRPGTRPEWRRIGNHRALYNSRLNCTDRAMGNVHLYNFRPLHDLNNQSF